MDSLFVQLVMILACFLLFQQKLEMLLYFTFMFYTSGPPYICINARE